MPARLPQLGVGAAAVAGGGRGGGAGMAAVAAAACQGACAKSGHMLELKKIPKHKILFELGAGELCTVGAAHGAAPCDLGFIELTFSAEIGGDTTQTQDPPVGGAAGGDLWCGVPLARYALLLLRVVLPLVERLDFANPAAMWISSRISASL